MAHARCQTSARSVRLLRTHEKSECLPWRKLENRFAIFAVPSFNANDFAQSEPVSEFQVEAQQKAGNVLERAMRQRDEQLDDAKTLNSLALYAKCATIRELQVEEKKRVKEEEKRVEVLATEMMEIERCALSSSVSFRFIDVGYVPGNREKAIRMYEERDRRMQEERLKGAAVIRQQIEARYALFSFRCLLFPCRFSFCSCFLMLRAASASACVNWS
jgi:hypothetical protein